MQCRHCSATLELPFLDLGTSPPSNSYLSREELAAPEKWFPLRVLACTRCWLVQTEDFTSFADLFSHDYAYFSSYSTSWLAHAERYVAAMVERFGLTESSHVVEIASNDGYLLQYVKNRGISCLGIEPTASTAAAARTLGIEVREEFFGVALAKQLIAEARGADLTAANNVLAHVPDINDFVAGFACLLKPNGVSTFEFPHLMRLVQDCQFDTVYHEHFSYLSLTAVDAVFRSNGLAIFDVEEIPTHGGSLRVFAQRADTGARPVTERARELLQRESDAGVASASYYDGLQPRANRVKDDFMTFLIDAKRKGDSVCAYGAAAKGNTLLNYAGVRGNLLPWVVDRNPAKSGKYLPGSRIPIVDEDMLKQERPKYIVILPWNLGDEVMQQLAYSREWGCGVRDGGAFVARPMKVAVTGASGFVGRHVLAELAKRDVQTHAFSRREPLGSGRQSAQHWTRLDIGNSEAAGIIMREQPDVVIHLAWSGLPNYKALHHFESELAVQYRFLSSLIRSGLSRLLVTGTCLEYGMQSGELHEDLVTDPQNPYGLAKDSLRRQLQLFCQKHSCRVTWARLFYMYGPEQPGTSLFSQLSAALYRGDATFPMSRGDQLRDFLAVEITAEIIVRLALDAHEAAVVNVCSGVPQSIRGLVESWLSQSTFKIALDLGRFPYPDYEPMAFWGSRTRLDRLLNGNTGQS